ncbi:MAG TPA: murein L,D-transpeptidase catalytic domain family protein [Draconibacterium sp.]|nr:murein L,D-transpeptidase catalytic domain family protein [Draconibacterium sp.]HRX12777.1 murein L,D-transpeptidase catalytic domain family protein [Draconibacterium sp.]
MKKIFLIILLILVYPVLEKAVSEEPYILEDKSDIYSFLNLSQLGLSKEAYQFAVKGFNKLKEQGQLLNSSILTIIDFSQSSNNKRLYVIDLYKKALLFNTYVAHGKNTGNEFAEKFSNIPGTFQSSLGFYVTENMAIGSKVGLSLILKGIEKGINDKAREREIIIHGADYATEDFIKKNGRLGRSFGCPSLPPDLIKPVAESIKDGTCLFIYKHDENYLNKSTVLN